MNEERHPEPGTKLLVALVGNPNCGKTSLFNALTGSRHHVGNWPGVTVEKRSGAFELDGLQIEVVDLPGIYSLSARSEDERIAAAFVVDPSVDLIVNVLDASNLERNLYLTTQLLELNKPMILALNMVDDAEKQGTSIDLPKLQELLDAPLVPTVGNRGEGVAALRKTIAEARRGQRPPCARVDYGADIEEELRKIEEQIGRDEVLAGGHPASPTALKLLERSPEAEQRLRASHARRAIEGQVRASAAFLEHHLGADCPTLVSERRYGFTHGLVLEVIQTATGDRRGLTERLDALLTNRWLGFPIFFAVMMAVYIATFVIGSYPQGWISAGISWLHDTAAAHLPPGELANLLVEGIIPGVGAVVVFVPVIMILMGCISFLEDTGYMSRAAFIMDRLMHLMGLHGKSFIPLVMGTGCNTPCIQATRTIESRSDRLITILVAPLISCSARLQVYICVAGAFFAPLHAAFVIIGLHVLGFTLAMLMGKALRMTLFRSAVAPFVMELPPYRMPMLRTTAIHMWEKGRVFLVRAGTVIFAGAVLIWFLSHYPGIANQAWSAEHQRSVEAVLAQKLPAEQEAERIEELDLAHQSRIMNSSLAARFGKVLQPLFAPILDPGHRRAEAWKDGVALTAGFAAKEIVVGTLGVVYQSRTESPGKEEGLSPLQKTLRVRSGLTPLTALAFLVFILIYTPCLGTVGMTLKETRSWAWTGFSVAYGLALGWLLSWLLVVVGRMLGFQ